jgi:hypothetical protein
MKRDKVIEKIEKDFPDFVDVVKDADEASLRNNMNIYAKYREELELHKSENAKLNALKEEVKEMNKPYADAVKVHKLKLAYINILLEEKIEMAKTE